MAEAARSRSVWARWTVRVAAALVALALGLTAALHTATVRRYALRRAASILQDTFNLRLQADDFDYSLVALRVAVTGVRVASARTPDLPFFTARRVIAAVPTSAIFGRFSIDSVSVDDGRVNIVRGKDGGTNLPETRDDEGGEPEPLRVRYLTAPGLAVEIADELNDVALSLPALHVRLGASSGRIELRERGRLTRGEVTTGLQVLRGGIGFDGRTVHLSNVALRTDEALVAIDGDVRLIVKDPDVILHVSGQGDVPSLARWATNAGPDVPRGRVEVDAKVKGPFHALTTAVAVRSSNLAWKGFTVTDVMSGARLTPAALQLQHLDARIAGGRVTGSGEMPFGAGESHVVVSWTELDLETLSNAFRLKPEATLPAKAGSYRPEATLLLSGRASGTLEARGSGVSLERWVIDARVRTARGTTKRARVAVDGTLDLGIDRGDWRLRAKALLAGVPLRAALNGRLDSENVSRSTIAGHIDVPETPVRQVLDVLQRTEIATVRMPDMDGTVRAATTVSGTFARPRLDMRGDGTLADVGALLPDAPLDGGADIRFEASGPPDGLRGRAQITVRDTRYAGVALGTLESTIDLESTAACIDATLRDFGATVSGSILVKAPHDATIDLQVIDADLSRLLSDVDSPVPITGKVSLRAHGTGPLDDWPRSRASVDLTSLDARAGSLPVRLTSPARVVYDNRVIDVVSLEVAAGETRLSSAGRLPVSADAPSVASGDALRITATGDLDEFAKAVVATGLVTVPEVSGTGAVAVLARISGTAMRPIVDGDLELGPGAIHIQDFPPVTGVHLRAHVDEDWIDVRDVTGVWQGSGVVAQGRVPASWAWAGLPFDKAQGTPGASRGVKAGPYRTGNSPDVGRSRPSGRPIGTFSARATSITPAVLAPFLEADTLLQLGGSIDASLQLQSASPDLSAVEGELRLDRLDLRIADLPVVQRVPTRVAFRDGFARITAWEWAGQGATVGVQGQVNLADRQAAILTSGRFDLRMLTPFIRDAGLASAGTLEPRVSITGPIDNPRVDGDVAIVAGEMRLIDPRVVATDISARAVLTRTTAQITSLAGTVNGGTLTGSGRVDFEPKTPLDANVALDVRGMALEFPEGLRSELSAALGVSVEVPPGDDAQSSGSLTGTVTVVRSGYREPLAVAAGLLAALRQRSIALAGIPTEASLLDRLTLDIRVLTEEDVIVDNNVGRLQLGADLRVIGTAAAPALSGRAELREGGQLFLGRNIYTLEQSGTIDFANPITIEPDLNIVAHTRAGGIDIVLACTGTPNTIACDPDAPDSPEPLGKIDLYSLLLTGRRYDDVAGDEADVVGEQALAYLSGDVLGFASRAVGLDTIRLGGMEQATLARDPSAVATELDPTARLTFGKSIGRAVDVTFSQSLRDSDAQTWIVDYRPRRHVELRLVSHDDDMRSYEFRHDVSFGGVTLDPSPPRVAVRRAPRIAAVTFSGAPVVSEATLRRALRLEVGGRFDFSEWQRDRDRLEAVLHGEGYYEARIAARRSGTDTVTLTYDIVAGPPTRIEVTGYELGDGPIGRIRAAWAQSVFDEFLVDDAREIVRSGLAAEGYLQPTIDVSLQRAGAASTLAIRIDPGARVDVRRVRFEGADPELTRALEAWLHDRPAERLATEDPDAFERELTAWLRARGHLRARVTCGLPSIARAEAIVAVTVDAGPVFLITGVRFEGAKGLVADRLRETVALAAGMPFDSTAVDAARDRLRTLYRREGFAAARVEARVDVNEPARRVNVTFVVEGGPRQVVSEVTVHGNRAIDSDVITRALDLPLNQPVGASAWLEARKRLFATGLFRRVDVAAEPAGVSAGADAVQPMRARVTVQEWPIVRLRYGFQLAEERPEGKIEGRDLVPGLSADVTRRTLFGRAITIGTGVKYQRRERGARVFGNAPTLLGLPVESSLVLERSHEQFAAATFVTDRSGVAWEQRLRPLRPLRISYSYRFDRDHTFDTRPPNPNIPSFDVVANVARLNAAAAFDTRNDPADATRGTLLSSIFEYAPEMLGSEFRFARYLGQAYYFRAWRRVVFASAVRYGLVAPLGGQELIPSERFLAGGARTVRGLPEDGLGPRDFFGDPAGGEALLILNQEVRFPIYRWLRGVGFVDAGNIYATRAAFAPGNLVGSGGFGVRLMTPFGIVRADYGRLVSPEPNQRPGRWSFGIGQIF